ncbi:MAG TPA: lysine exporter LysO family protein [Bacteroidales bacterium]|nr:lysine exporter LysO family protein [Bacteroidales bacterium]
MKGSIIILFFFILGLLAGIYQLLPEHFLVNDYSLYALYLLMFLVGIGIGNNKKSLQVIKKINFKILLVPLSVITGTYIGVSIFALLQNQLNIAESLAIGSGFGYYSLSSVLISEVASDTLGVIALLSNITREIITLLLTPFFARYFGKLAPISSGGATAMDTTLPIITQYIGSDYAIISVFSGIVLTILVPFLIAIIL